MVSEGEDIASKMDAVYRETSLPGSQYGLGSLAMLHHECRHMAAHLGAANEEYSIKEDRPETTTLRQVDKVTARHEVCDRGRWTAGCQRHGVGLVRVKDDVYNTPPTSGGT